MLFQGYIEFGLGVEVLRYLAIFFAVLRYLPKFFAVLRCSEPSNVPLMKAAVADIKWNSPSSS